MSFLYFETYVISITRSIVFQLSASNSFRYLQTTVKFLYIYIFIFIKSLTYLKSLTTYLNIEIQQCIRWYRTKLFVQNCSYKTVHTKLFVYEESHRKAYSMWNI